MHKIWVADDDEAIRMVLEESLSSAGFLTSIFPDADSLLEQLKTDKPDLIITDVKMPGSHGYDLLKYINDNFDEIPVIIMTAFTDMQAAIDSYGGGAFEYMPKPFDLDEAIEIVNRALEGKPTTKGLKSKPSSEIIGKAASMQLVFRAIGKLSNTNATVLIQGESGTGKELIAKSLHKNSPRNDMPFVALNMADIPKELVESELFGHEKGAFTGAQAQRLGRFEQAQGGTLFLDEIGEMPAELQTRLLRVLSDRRFYRVGGRQLVDVDVRVLAATNRNLERQVEEGHFREDLYHRLNVIRINLPSLSERAQDVTLLAERFLKESARELQVERKVLTPEAVDCLQSYEWPGNVRQLENICRWITVMAPANKVTMDDLPKEITGFKPEVRISDWQQALAQHAHSRVLLGKQDILLELTQQFESTLLTLALEHTDGHRQNAAKLLGWGRNTLTRKLKELGLDAV